MNVPLEDQEAKVLSSWMKSQGILHTHIANEKKASYGFHTKLKAMGLSKGFPDYMIIVPTKTQGKCTVFIELKRQRRVLKNGKLGKSPSDVKEEQIEWVEKLNECESTEAVICFGAQESIEYIEELLEI